MPTKAKIIAKRTLLYLFRKSAFLSFILQEDLHQPPHHDADEEPSWYDADWEQEE